MNDMAYPLRVRRDYSQPRSDVVDSIDHDSHDEDKPQFDQDDLVLLQEAEQNPKKVLTSRPVPLGCVSVACIIINRMIGTGIFKTPSTVMQGTGSVGISMLFWVIGGIASIAGILVYTEFGLTIPRHEFDGEKKSVPRSGGEKNYLEYVLKKPRLLATCLYGIPFIFLGNAAGNGIAFAEYLLAAIGVEASNGTVRGVAVAVVTLACLIHGIWRKGGIYLNNFFAIIKLLVLVMIFIVGVCAAAGVFTAKAIAKNNLNVHHSFSDSAVGSYGYSEAFLGILYAFGGFNQANYVLGEIKQPQRFFKVTTISTVILVSIMYLLVNIAYMIVVSKTTQSKQNSNVALTFFQLTIGHDSALRVLSGLMAFSSLGNILVQTFTAARVKQEIAKEGVLPCSKFFARNSSIMNRNRNSDQSADATPIGALLLHWIFAVLLILGSWQETPNAVYKMFVNFYSFTIDALFGFCVGLGMLALRLNNNRSHWSRKSLRGKWSSICAATIFAITNLFPLVASWLPPNGGTFRSLIPWWVTGTVGMSLLGLGFLYWFVLYFVLPHIWGRRLEVERESIYHNEYGYPVVWHEVVSFGWEVK